MLPFHFRSRPAIRLFILFSVALLQVMALEARAAIRDGQVDANFAVTPIVNDGVSRITCFAPLPDGKVLVGGSFVNVSGGSSNNIARLHADGTFDPAFHGNAGSQVLGVFPLADGKILISGDFLQYDGIARNRIARLNADGSLDQTFNPSLGQDYVQAIAVQPDQRIIIVGTFQSIGGIPRNRIARLNSDGTLDLSFDGGAGINNAAVRKAAVQSDGKIILIGRFSTYNDVPRNGIARINSDGSLDTSFVPSSSIGDPAEYFDISLASDGKICLAIDAYGSRVVRLSADGSLDPSFNTGSLYHAGGRVYSVLAQPDGKVLVGGEFDGFSINGSLNLRYRLFRFNSDGSVDQTFQGQAGNSVSSGGVRALSLYGADKVLVGGDFPQLNGSTRGGIGRLNMDSSLDASFNGFFGRPSFIFGSYIYPDGRILVSGDFSVVNGAFTQNVARLMPDGTVDNSFRTDPAVNSRVGALAVQPDGKIILGGNADDFFGLRKGIWRVNSDGSLDSSFDARIDALTAVGSIIVEPDGKILIAGGFTAVNGISRRCIARLNSDGSLDPSFNPVFGALSVSSIVRQADGKTLAGGNFTSVNGVQVGNIVRLNSDGTTDTTFNTGTGANNFVYSISVRSDGLIYVGGQFSTFSGESRRSIVRLLANGSIDAAFKSVKVSSAVFSILQLPDGKIVIGGTVESTINAAQRTGIIRLFDNGTIDFSFDVKGVIRNTSMGEVFRLGMQPGGRIIATGQFESINGSPRWGIARLLSFPKPTRPVFDFDGDGKTDLSLFRPSNGTWVLQRSQAVSPFNIQLGNSTDKLVPADYDGDFLTDEAIYRPSDGNWHIYNVASGTVSVVNLGTANDIPVPGDYDGDGKTDLAIFRPSDGNWWLKRSRDGLIAIRYGSYGDLPAVGDYDGDGRSDIGVFRPLTGEWIILRSTDGELRTHLGQITDKIVPADYDGDGKTDIAVFRPSDGVWHIAYSASSTQGSIPFGLSTDVPVPADYDGDERTDIAVFRQSDTSWRLQRSTAGEAVITFGQNSDIPVPSAFVRAANFVSISGRIVTPSGLGLRNTVVSILDSQNVVRTATTSSSGQYFIDNIVNGSYTVRVSSRRYRFATQALQINSNLTNVDFTGLE